MALLTLVKSTLVQTEAYSFKQSCTQILIEKVITRFKRGENGKQGKQRCKNS